MTRAAEDSAHDTGVTGPTVDDLRVMLAELVEEEPEDVDPEANLFEQGLQSIALMRLVARWRSDGHDVGFADLAEEPTLVDWVRLLTRRVEAPAAGAPAAGAPAAGASAAGASAVPAGVGADGAGRPDDAGAEGGGGADAAGDEFDLALLQHAYWIGRDPGQRLGGVAPHLYLEFDGSGVEPDRLRAAFEAVVRRHGMLRARIGDNGRQTVPEPAGWDALRVHDLRPLPPEDARARLDAIRDRMSHELLDIAGGEVFRAELSLLPAGLDGRGDAPTRLHLDVDMISADAVSYRAMLADLARAYDRPGEPLPELGYTYREYLAARPAARREAGERARRYWADRLPTLPGAPELPPAADPGETARAVRLAFFLDGEQRAEVTRACRARGITPSAAVATVFAEVIGAWSTQPRFLLNVPLFDREPVHPEIDQVVGDFTGSVMLEVDLTEPATVLERARAVQARLHADTDNRDHPGLEVLRDLGRLTGDQVLAPVVFTSGLDLGELFDPLARGHFGDPVWIMSQGPQVVLDAQTSEIDGGILVNWDVRENEFAPGVPAAMFTTFTRLVRALADGATWDNPVGDLLPADQRAVRERANDTDRPDAPDLLHRRFFARAGGRGDQTAVAWAGGTLSHRELAARALRVAGGLRAHGVAPGDPVAVTLPRGPGQVIAAPGVLAAGGTYVPVGVEQPAARADRIAAVSGHTVVIATDTSGDRVALDDLLAAVPLAAPEPVDPEQPAYLLFTSGSTGEPKGVEVPHRAAMATIDDLIRRLRLGPADRTLMVSALNFDLSVFDIFAMLSVGGAVVVVDQEQRREPAHWSALIREHSVTLLNCVPALLDALLRSVDGPGGDLGGSLRQVILGGDKVGTDLPARLRERVPGCAFAGLGGTTETAIHSTWQDVPGEAPADWSCVPYGTPLDNVRLRVVDPLGRDAPDWVPGELWIGGNGVARGYRRDPGRTADRFLLVDGVRWYRTGDMGRYRPDGTVEFLGRRDNQVKVNGYRIELGEVEAAALDLPGVDAAVAVVLGDTTRSLALAVRPGPDADRAGPGAGPAGPGAGPGGPRADPAGPGTEPAGLPGRVAAELAERLPVHMLPRTVVVLDTVPLTANGKIDRPAVTRLVGVLRVHREALLGQHRAGVAPSRCWSTRTCGPGTTPRCWPAPGRCWRCPARSWRARWAGRGSS